MICGGGAIGAAIAYFTSRRGARSTVIERHEVAGAASGKSGGFLALDWCRGSSLDRLARGASSSMSNFPSSLAILGLSASDDLRRLRRRGRYRARCRRTAVWAIVGRAELSVSLAAAALRAGTSADSGILSRT